MNFVQVVHEQHHVTQEILNFIGGVEFSRDLLLLKLEKLSHQCFATLAEESLPDETIIVHASRPVLFIIKQLSIVDDPLRDKLLDLAKEHGCIHGGHLSDIEQVSPHRTQLVLF